MLNQKNKKLGCSIYFLTLFGIPFALVGIFLAYRVISTFYDAYNMSDWQQITAKIISTELKENRSNNSITYSVNVVYQYEISDKNYKGTRINISSGSESGSYYPKLYQKLKRHKNSGESYTCFVNQESPENSILNKELRLKDLVIFPAVSLLFTGVGITLIIFGIFVARKTKICNELELQNPNLPWLHKPEWADGKIKASNKTLFITSVFVALFWNLLSWPVAIMIIPEILKNKEYVGLFVLLFPIVGIGIIIWAILAFSRWKKFGESVFVMKSNPGLIGGALEGFILSATNVKPENGFKIELNCINRYRSGSGKKRNTSETILWQDICMIKHEIYEKDLTKSVIPVLFKIPFELKETNDGNPNNKIIWRLKISADLPGIDYKSVFEIPVFKTKDSSKSFELDPSVLDKYIEKPSQANLTKNNKIICEQLTNGGVKFTFPIAWKQSIIIFLFVLVFGGISGFLWTKPDVPIIFNLILMIFVSVMIFAFLDLLLYKSEVTAHKNSLLICSGLKGFRSVKNIDFSDVLEIKATRGMQAGNKLFYSIKLILKTGNKICIAKRIDSLQKAKFIIEQLYDTKKKF